MRPASRAVFRELLRRELDERHRGSVLGAVWLLVLPLMQLAVLALVFGHLLPARAAGGDLPYAAFLALGLWPWMLFANAAGRGVGALAENAALIGKVAIPHRVLVDSRALASVLLDLAGFAVVLAVLWSAVVAPAPGGLPAIAAGLAVAALHGVALARVLAVLQVFLRDIGAVVGQLLALGFFLTPVLYDAARLPGGLGHWLALNPLAAAIAAVRAGATGLPAAWGALAAALASGLLLWWLASALLSRARAHLEDFL